MADYWYLWLILVLLIVILFVAGGKASKASNKRHAAMQKEIEAIEKEKALREKFKTLTPELLQATPMPELLEGVTAGIQVRIEHTADLTAAFNNLPEHERFCYALNYFFADSRDALSEFFKKNGEPLTSLAPKALAAAGSTLAQIVRDMLSMYDAENEAVSYDEATVAELNKKFAATADFELLSRQIEDYIHSNFL
ncbi:MAG: hypothetical protein LBS36_07230 [Oscillospiraceae bacterium]|jgi:hypothetical protein|nr:hypothetical protein [Oscillospiraceae bacterium]